MSKRNQKIDRRKKAPDKSEENSETQNIAKADEQKQKALEFKQQQEEAQQRLEAMQTQSSEALLDPEDINKKQKETDQIIDDLEGEPGGFKEILKAIMEFFKQFTVGFKDSIESLNSTIDDDQKSAQEETASGLTENQEQNKYFSDIEITDKSKDRSGEGTLTHPYRTNEKRTEIAPGKFITTSNSGNIGTHKGKENYNHEKAKSQIEYLNKERRVIFTFGKYRHEIAGAATDAVNGTRIAKSPSEVANINTLIQRENPPLVVAPITIHTSTDNFEKNTHIYQGIGRCLREGYGVHTCCDHGAHRAIISMMCGWLESGRVNSLGEAYVLAGGNVKDFIRDNTERNHKYRVFFRQAVNLAMSKGIHVEPIFIDFTTNESFRPNHTQVLSQLSF